MTLRYHNPIALPVQTYDLAGDLDAPMRHEVHRPFVVAAQHDREIGGRRVLVWSLNWVELPICPGILPRNLRRVLATSLCDSGLGKWDFRYTAQIVTGDNLHLAFVQPPLVVTDDSPKEWISFSDALWNSHTSTFDPAYLKDVQARLNVITRGVREKMDREEVRAFAPGKFRRGSWCKTQDILDSLFHETDIHKALMMYAELQQLMVEGAAFTTYASARLKYRIDAIIDRTLPIPWHKRDLVSYVGCFANLLDETTLNWLIDLGIPVFFFYVYGPEDDEHHLELPSTGWTNPLPHHLLTDNYITRWLRAHPEVMRLDFGEFWGTDMLGPLRSSKAAPWKHAGSRQFTVALNGPGVAKFPSAAIQTPPKVRNRFQYRIMILWPIRGILEGHWLNWAEHQFCRGVYLECVETEWLRLARLAILNDENSFVIYDREHHFRFLIRFPFELLHPDALAESKDSLGQPFPYSRIIYLSAGAPVEHPVPRWVYPTKKPSAEDLLLTEQNLPPLTKKIRSYDGVPIAYKLISAGIPEDFYRYFTASDIESEQMLAPVAHHALAMPALPALPAPAVRAPVLPQPSASSSTAAYSSRSSAHGSKARDESLVTFDGRFWKILGSGASFEGLDDICYAPPATPHYQEVEVYSLDIISDSVCNPPLLRLWGMHEDVTVADMCAFVMKAIEVIGFEDKLVYISLYAMVCNEQAFFYLHCMSEAIAERTVRALDRANVDDQVINVRHCMTSKRPLSLVPLGQQIRTTVSDELAPPTQQFGRLKVDDDAPSGSGSRSRPRTDVHEQRAGPSRQLLRQAPATPSTPLVSNNGSQGGSLGQRRGAARPHSPYSNGDSKSSRRRLETTGAAFVRRDTAPDSPPRSPTPPAPANSIPSTSQSSRVIAAIPKRSLGSRSTGQSSSVGQSAVSVQSFVARQASELRDLTSRQIRLHSRLGAEVGLVSAGLHGAHGILHPHLMWALKGQAVPCKELIDLLGSHDIRVVAELYQHLKDEIASWKTIVEWIDDAIARGVADAFTLERIEFSKEELDYRRKMARLLSNPSE